MTWNTHQFRKNLDAYHLNLKSNRINSYLGFDSMYRKADGSGNVNEPFLRPSLYILT